MIDTEEYYGGKYPEPHEVIIEDDEDEDFDEWYADYYHDEFMLGGIE